MRSLLLGIGLLTATLTARAQLDTSGPYVYSLYRQDVVLDVFGNVVQKIVKNYNRSFNANPGYMDTQTWNARYGLTGQPVWTTYAPGSEPTTTWATASCSGTGYSMTVITAVATDCYLYQAQSLRKWWQTEPLVDCSDQGQSWTTWYMNLPYPGHLGWTTYNDSPNFNQEYVGYWFNTYLLQ